MGVFLIEPPSQVVDRDPDIAPASLKICFLHQALFDEPVDDLGEIAPVNAETVGDRPHVFPALLIFQKILQNLDLGIGIGDAFVMHLLGTVHRSVDVAVMNQGFHDFPVFTHPFKLHDLSFPEL